MLGGALLSQYWGGFAPCELCLKERWPWTAAIVISFVATMTGSRRALPRVVLLLALVFAVGSALAFYHVGVEKHWFHGPSACTASGTPTTLEALKAQLLHQQPVRCDEPRVVAVRDFARRLEPCRLAGDDRHLRCDVLPASRNGAHRNRQESCVSGAGRHRLPGDPAPATEIERMMRVDHAGEFGATRI